MLPFAAVRICTVVNEFEKLKGTWVWVATEEKGHTDSLPLGLGFKYVFKGKTYLIPEPLDDEATHTERGSVRINPLRNPKEITMYDGRTGRLVASGIYKLDGNRLTICFGKERPKKFTSDIDRQWVLHLRRPTLVDAVAEVLWVCLPPELRW
jgi:uncharacterized protein (TIGR03067 family)